MIIGNYNFPEPSDIRVLMMPFIQGDPDSLPDDCKGYSSFVSDFYLEKGEVGYLTIDNSLVNAGDSQRGYGSEGRSIHTEACFGYVWGTPTWGQSSAVSLDEDLEVLIANNIDNTCRVWNTEEQPTIDGMVRPDKYLESSGKLLKSGEVAKISILTPHECVPQKKSGHRQFLRIVGSGVHGSEDAFTVNPKVSFH